MTLSRRRLLQGSAIAAALPLMPFLAPATARADTAAAAGGGWHHGLSLFGDLKYPQGFAQFDYVRADAPKGGVARQISIGTFDNFNIAVAGVKGSIASSVMLVYETLMTPSLDEVSAEYGLLAEAASHPADFSSATYRLRAEARWHDGRPVTPEDVIWSLGVFKQHSPMYASYYRHVVKAEKVGERDVLFTFDAPGNRELPHIVGQLIVLPQHWWEGTDEQGRKRDVSVTTLERPLGSGPYRIREFVAGRSVTFERVKDYWGAKVPAQVGQHNFDELRYEFFRDETVALEAFKADQADWFIERRAKSWATAYDFPAVQDKRVLLEEFPIRNSGRMQAFVLNLRRDVFKDARLRRAFNFAFDFEEMNRQLFYGQYTRIKSYFEGTELASSGLPEGQELEILETVRDKVPPEVFTTPYTNPVGGSAEAMRANLREAMRLLKEARFEIRDRKLIDPAGKPVIVEMLLRDPSSERIALFYKPSLERLGVTVTIRTVDDVQYQNRLRSFDFDIITDLWGQSLSPGNEQRDFWGSAAADQEGTRNTIGIKSPVIDAIIEKLVVAHDRDELVATTRALDRVLLWGHYVVPQWYNPFQWIATWDIFGRPEKLPSRTAAFTQIWWVDPAKEQALAAHRK